MLEVAVCPECGVPKPFTEDNVWLNSGAMVQAGDETRRVGFIESENLDPVYKGIEEIIGVPINHLVIDVIRKGTLDYIRNITLPKIQERIESGEQHCRFSDDQRPGIRLRQIRTHRHGI